jgi:hypothetical protein
VVADADWRYAPAVVEQPHVRDVIFTVIFAGDAGTVR